MSVQNPAMVLPDWLSRQREMTPNQVALEWDEGSLSYETLYRLAIGMADILRNEGVEPGHHVAVLAKSGVQFAITMHALMQLGAILIPLNWRLTEREMAWQVDDAGARLLLADHPLFDTAQATSAMTDTKPNVKRIESIREAASKSENTTAHRTDIQLDDTHAIIYTSGTTGHPKGTMIQYGNEWWSAVASALNFGLDKSEKWLVPMPLFHVGGLSVLIRSVIYGTTAYIQDGFDAQSVNDAIDNRGVTLVSVVPTMLQRMLAVREGKPYPSHLRSVLLGGSAASKPLLLEAQHLGVPVAQSYGLTETASQFCTLDPARGLDKLGSSGRPLLPNRIRIDEGPDGIGEILVQGPSVTSGYYKRPDATRLAFEDGWFRTGDIGYLDDEGFLYVLDRRKDLIVSGGENIYPAEVEAVLLQHPAVSEAAVVGASHLEWGQVPAAFVVTAEPLTEDELETYCRSVLAGYKVPKHWLFIDELPRNASGKLLRRNLREWLENHPEQFHTRQPNR